MKRYLAALLALLMTLTLAACGGDDSPARKPVQPTGQQNTPSASDKDAPSEQEESQTPTASEPTGPAHLQIYSSSRAASRADVNDGYRLLAEVEWNGLMLGEESAAAYPLLAETLRQLNEENEAYFAEDLEDLEEAAKEMAVDNEYFGGYVSSSEYHVQRADDRILSIREYVYSYTGGVHPNYAVLGINLNPETGEWLTLADVLTDWTKVRDILCTRIPEKYDYEPFESLPEMLADYTDEDFTWTMDHQGITFWFSPYEIASYAAGLLTVRISFEEMPDLFVPEYTQIPDGSWALPLPLYNDVEINGHDLWLGAYEQEDGFLTVSLTHNGAKYSLSELCGYFIKSYLVCHGDRYFLYIEMTEANDYNFFYVYELTEEGPVSCQVIDDAGFGGIFVEDEGSYGIWYEEVLTTPDRFELSSTIQRLGTWSGSRTYTPDPADGTPLSPETEYYTLPADIVPIHSTVELEVTLLKDGSKASIPAGTAFYLLRSDGEAYAELRLEDGRECRIEFTYEDYETRINGIPEWECFEDLVYAG